MNEAEKDEVVLLYLDDIIPNRFQPREVFDERALKELAVSIKEHGVIQPIIVRNINGKYEIIAGERRYKASALAGLTKIPAIIRNLDDKESSKVALLENLQRKNLNAIAEARTYQKILELDEMTQEDLAKTMGKSQSAVANKIRLLSLPDEVQESLLKEQISERHARALLNVSDLKVQKELLKKVINEKISVRMLEEEINKLYPKESNGENIPTPSEVSPSASEFLNSNPLTPTGVDIKEESDNYGKVVIAPPEGEEGRFINYGEINKDNNEEFDESKAVPQINVDTIKEQAQDINPDEHKADIDNILNIGAKNLTPADKIDNEIINEEGKKSEDYFKAPDLTDIPNTNISNINPFDNGIEENYTLEIAQDKIKALIEDIRNKGMNITADEMDFPNSYQIIIKLEK